MRFRFTIRDLLWLTALIAMGIGWWLDRSKLASDWKLEIDQINAALEGDAIMEGKHQKIQIVEIPDR